MKVYAKQVPPEYQESPLFLGEWPENVFVFGNDRLKCRNGDTIENLQSAMYDAADELKQLMRGRVGFYASFVDIVAGLLPAPEHKNEYSRADRLEWRRLLLAYDAGAVCGFDAARRALELSTGREWECSEIRGSCQGDWQNVIFPAEYGREWLAEFETEYFNTGDEWQITESDPESNECYYFYTHEWSDDGKRAEIAAAAGVNPGDVILYTFDGWRRVAEYSEVV
jgi:hypothetical protein